MKSVFVDKNVEPSIIDLSNALGDTYHLWNNLVDYTLSHYSKALLEWKFSGAKHGWSFRVKDKKRVIIYLLPRDNYFKTAFVFGENATKRIIESDVSESIKSDLMDAKPYVEGRGIRIDIKDNSDILDIQKLIIIKLST